MAAAQARTTYDVVIVGMGPAGSTAAAALSRGGLAVLGLDKDSHPVTRSAVAACRRESNRCWTLDFGPSSSRPSRVCSSFTEVGIHWSFTRPSPSPTW